MLNIKKCIERVKKMLQEQKMEHIFGYELCLDLFNCDKKLIRSKRHIASFVKKLVKEIDMVLFGDPIIVHFGTGQAKGYTLMQLIETSSIVGHFKESDNSAYIDIFSCKEFDSIKTQEFVKNHFNAGGIKATFLVRGI